MNLEQLIERARAALQYLHDIDDNDPAADGVGNALRAKEELADFVLRHADELVSWERTHAARTSPLDGEGT